MKEMVGRKTNMAFACVSHEKFKESTMPKIRAVNVVTPLSV